MTFQLDIQLQQITSLQVICKVSKATLHDVDEAVMAAKEAFEEGPWGGMNARDRGEIMYKLVKRLKVIALITYFKLFNDIKVSNVFRKIITINITNCLSHTKFILL